MFFDTGIPRFHYFKDDGKVKWSVDEIYINREKKVLGFSTETVRTEDRDWSVSGRKVKFDFDEMD